MTKHRLWLRMTAHIDLPLLLGTLLLLMLSLLILYSADTGALDRPSGQLINILVALTVMIAVANMPLHILLQLAVPIYVIGLLLLLAVALFGDVVNGARRWLNLGFISLQPSEIMKVGLPMMMAWYFERNESHLSYKTYFIAFLLMLVPTILILRQPDLGTTLLICVSGFYVLFLAGLRWRIMLGLAAIAAASAPFAWSMLHDYQRQRVMMLLDPTMDALGKGYHTIQSMIAVGSGGVLGKGYMNGTQTQLEFLPERTTDFIFAVYSEEFGFIGNIILFLLYAFILARGFMITAKASTPFTRLMAGSITMTMATYVFVNIGMVSGILPVVGVPLPLVSYGGTAMITLTFGIGMLMSIETHKKLLKS